MSAQPKDFLPQIRLMQAADIDQVLAIETRSYNFPWSRGIFTDCLIAGYYAIVAEADGKICGYSITSSAGAEAHILNLCVDPDWRQRRIGRRLLDTMVAYAEHLGIIRMFLEVRPSNPAAIALYEQAGFIRLGKRSNYYRAHDGREDALVLMREW